jgi:integrase
LTDYVLILANSGLRVGEANNLKIRDLELFEDDLGRRNYRFKVKGKTGERDVILRASARRRPACGADLAFLAHFHQLSKKTDFLAHSLGSQNHCRLAGPRI